MPVETIQNGSSWFLGTTDTAVTEEPTIPTSQEQNVPTVIPKGTEVQPGETDTGEEPKVEDIETPPPADTANILPGTITEVFEKLKADDSGMFGFYENKKIETLEDIVDFVDINANFRVEKALHNAETQWLQRKSPVFQQFAEMAELAGDDHTKLYAFMETQQQIDDYTTLDPTNPTHAELIIENHMKSLGKSKEIIDEEIKDIKELNKLTERAEKYKPLVIKNLEVQKQKTLQDEKEAEIQYFQAIDTNEKEVINFLQPDTIGGMRVKNEDKDIIHEDLTFDNEIKGFRIYQKIEEKQKAKDFETLAIVSLILNNRERFNELYGSNIKATVAKDLRGKIVFGSKTVEAGKPIDQKTNTPQQVGTPQIERDPAKPWYLP